MANLDDYLIIYGCFFSGVTIDAAAQKVVQQGSKSKEAEPIQTCW